ncbi:unnamed protein product [Pylaiella littoralis]
MAAWRSPWRGRMKARPRPLSVIQLEKGEQDEGEDTPNLFRVTHVPTYEEMLAWAEETDKRIAAGELPPLGSRPTPSAGAATAAGDNLLSDQEQAQMAALSELLSKRRRQGSLLSDAEETSLRAAMTGLSESVENPDFDGDYAATSFSSSDDGNGPVITDERADDLVRNQVYGSREVRDKIYLYAWSLMKDRQEQAETEAPEQQEGQRR